MIIIPKHQDIIVELPRRGVGLLGLVKLTKGKTLANGREVITGETGWFKNIITNTGLNGIADTALNLQTAYCHCGTGTATETANDTALQTWVAQTNTAGSADVETAQSTAPYYFSATRTKRFDEGDAEGNIAEIGFGPNATNTALWSRARVKTVGGTPTTITVDADEWLDVSYQVRIYPDHVLSGGGLDDGTGTISLSGTNYDYTVRPCFITATGYYGNLFGNSIKAQALSRSTAEGYVYGSDSTLGAVTGGISSGTAGQEIPTASFAAYSTDAFNRDITWSLALGQGNIDAGTPGLKGFELYTGFGSYQMLFDTVAPKDATKTMTLVSNLAWARATIP